VQPTTTYVASPPPPPAPTKQNVRHRHARVVHKAPKPKVRHRAHRPAGAVLAARALAAGPKVATVAPAGTGRGSSWSILLAFLILPVLLGLAATLPAERMPQRMGSVFEQHRTDLAIAGVIGFGAVLVAWLVTFVLGSGGG
jgi:hypothetical protein